MLIRYPKEIMKKNLIEDFFHLPPVSTTPVVHLELRISPWIFEKIRNGPNDNLGLGDSVTWGRATLCCLILAYCCVCYLTVDPATPASQNGASYYAVFFEFLHDSVQRSFPFITSPKLFWASFKQKLITVLTFIMAQLWNKRICEMMHNPPSWKLTRERNLKDRFCTNCFALFPF